MAVTQVLFEGNGKDLQQQVGVLEFDTSTATITIATDFARVYGASFTKIITSTSGAIDTVVLDEASQYTSGDGYIAVTGGTVTVDRIVEGAGTIPANSDWFYVLWGTK